MQSSVQYVNQTITVKGYTKDKKFNINQIEPKVINEQLIQDCIKQFNQDNKIIVAAENLVFQQLRQLQISFKNIVKIQNLSGFERLEKLQLDNNKIVKIENIDHLINIKWLDLSFNLIKKIEGLDTLKELKDLSLYNNQIEKVEGLYNNLKLNVFSIGNNKIQSYEEITQYFQYKKNTDDSVKEKPHFKHLQVLNIEGNPFTKTKEKEYKTHIICAIPNLKYLDYVFIDEGDRNLIRQTEENIFALYQITTDEYEKQMKEQEIKENEIKQQLKRKKDAKMDNLDRLKDELVYNDDLEKMKVINKIQINEEIEKFKQKVETLVKEIMQTPIILRHQLILEDLEKYEQQFKQREILHEKEALGIVQKFEHDRKIAFRDWIQNKKNDKQLKELYEKTFQLKNDLMDIEVQLVDELEAAQTEFESLIKERFSKEIDPHFDNGSKKVDECIQEFYNKLNDIKSFEEKMFHQSLENNEDDQQEVEFDERENLLENKESLNQMLMQIKDNMLEAAGKIITSSQTAVNQEQQEYSNKKKSYMYERNRKNVQQIITQTSVYQNEIQQKLEKHDSDSDHEQY